MVICNSLISQGIISKKSTKISKTIVTSHESVLRFVVNRGRPSKTTVVRSLLNKYKRMFNWINHEA